MLRFAEEGTDFGIACSLQEETSTPNFWRGVCKRLTALAAFLLDGDVGVVLESSLASSLASVVRVFAWKKLRA
jgi:hypothetical protein